MHSTYYVRSHRGEMHSNIEQMYGPWQSKFETTLIDVLSKPTVMDDEWTTAVKDIHDFRQWYNNNACTPPLLHPDRVWGLFPTRKLVGDEETHERGQRRLAELITRAGMSPNASFAGSSRLHSAASSFEHHRVDELINQGAYVNAKTTTPSPEEWLVSTPDGATALDLVYDRICWSPAQLKFPIHGNWFLATVRCLIKHGGKVSDVNATLDKLRNYKPISKSHQYYIDRGIHLLLHDPESMRPSVHISDSAGT